MGGVDDLRAWRMVQSDRTKCGSAVALAVRALADGGYASGLGAVRELAAEQARIHRATNRIWPRSLGTPPWGLVAELNRHSRRPYRWRTVRRSGLGRRSGIGRGLDEVVDALDAGWPVPLLIGALVPRHYVLLVAPSPDGIWVYDPANGTVRAVARSALRGEGAWPFGWPRVFGYAVPR